MSDDSQAYDGPHLQDALRAAASAAAVGAAVGAARAYSARRDEKDDDDDAPDKGHHDVPYMSDVHDEVDDEPQPQSGISQDDARGIVAEARRVLQDLHGADAESVSSVAKGANGWKVGLEVVEVRRIPDSTDVLATYEVELDDEGRLLRFERARRYHRSEADRGGRG
jgi:hypothetical protein